MQQAAPPVSWPSPWGADDELGMLNHVTPAKRLQALELVREGRLYDLGRVLDEHVPVFPGRAFHQTLVTTAHHANMGGVGENRVNWITEVFSGTTQLGTHLDALSHLQVGDRAYNGRRVNDIASPTLVDVAGLEPEPGDAVLFHTGWGALWNEPPMYLSGEPGPGLEVAEWLAAQGVALTGCDTWSYGPVPAEDPARPFEVPQLLNVRHGVFVVENLDTSALAGDGVEEFALVLTHPKLRGATGAWTSPIALV